MDHKHGGFAEASPDALRWQYRAPLLLEELTRHGKANFILLEECDHYHDFFLLAMPDLGFEGRFLEICVLHAATVEIQPSPMAVPYFGDETA